MSETTKHYRLWYWVFFIFSILLNVSPLAGYAIKAMIESDLIYEKVTLVTTVFIVLIMTCVSLVNKVAMRSRLWVILIGLYFCLDYILTPLMIIAVCQIVDELIVSPLKHSFREKLVINKQIDRRLR